MMKKPKKTKNRKMTNNAEIPLDISPKATAEILIKKGKMGAAAFIKAECMASMEAAAGASTAQSPSSLKVIRNNLLLINDRPYPYTTSYTLIRTLTSVRLLNS